MDDSAGRRCVAESLSTLFETDVQFDFVINCAGETKLGQTDAVSCCVHGCKKTRFLKIFEKYFKSFF